VITHPRAVPRIRAIPARPASARGSVRC
jgi:hypothetical protein